MGFYGPSTPNKWYRLVILGNGEGSSIISFYIIWALSLCKSLSQVHSSQSFVHNLSLNTLQVPQSSTSKSLFYVTKLNKVDRVIERNQTSSLYTAGLIFQNTRWDFHLILQIGFVLRPPKASLCWLHLIYKPPLLMTTDVPPGSH